MKKRQIALYVLLCAIHLHLLRWYAYLNFILHIITSTPKLPTIPTMIHLLFIHNISIVYHRFIGRILSIPIIKGVSGGFKVLFELYFAAVLRGFSCLGLGVGTRGDGHVALQLVVLVAV